MRHSATGYTPFYLLKGYEANMPTSYVDEIDPLTFDSWEEQLFARISALAALIPAIDTAKSNIQKSQEKQENHKNTNKYDDCISNADSFI